MEDININMPIISLNSQVLSSFTIPSNLSYSLSAGSFGYNTVNLLTTGTTLTGGGGKQVLGIAFDSLALPGSGSGLFATLSVFNGTTLRVDTQYNGSTFAVIYTDRSSSLFTVVTGAGTTLQTLTANSFDTIYPDVVRLRVLEYI